MLPVAERCHSSSLLLASVVSWCDLPALPRWFASLPNAAARPPGSSAAYPSPTAHPAPQPAGAGEMTNIHEVFIHVRASAAALQPVPR